HEVKKKADTVSFYTLGNFTDLCRGPHVTSTNQIGHFRLLNMAGAYWRGSEKNPMLTRIYGTVWPTKAELEKHLWQLEEIKKRDHRKLGRELELFMFHETAPGMPYWLPNGLIILNALVDFWRDYHRASGYLEISTPLINEKRLWETSGHWEFYKDSMFIIPVDEHITYGVKPMNCPNAMVVFASQTRSYKDLPLRLADTDILHRLEKSGTLSGLFRVQKMQQDDAHIFVSENQVEKEYEKILKIADDFYSLFGLQYRLRLGTRPDEFLGNGKTWDKAEAALKKILEESGKEHFILEGDGAFYGPKIDILMKDALGREWQMGTIQLDFQLPERFDLKYQDGHGQQKTPVVIHRVIYGSLERFIGILIEHFAGNFPVWLAPVQAVVLPITDRNTKYAEKVLAKLQEAGIRAEIDGRSETLKAKIRDAQLQKIPYMLIVGDKEEKNKTVSERGRSGKDYGQCPLETFITNIKKEIASKSLL
ncbi:MAG: threonine--tRNA ligase, partial [Candidatus Blackburnbacteria bacterium]|nr:threonine--tRNA ligase [Candidatus Blackburnbacteria bacterium]